MRIAILGCGPAGLMAAQGVTDAHRDNGVLDDMQMAIISRKVKSPMFGSQYLHRPIPAVTRMESRHISYQLRGDADDYRRKVYGKKWAGPVSPEDLAEDHLGWDIRDTYDMLWRIWEYAIVDGEVEPQTIIEVLDPSRAVIGSPPPELIINSLPRPALCHDEGHSFGATEIWAAGDAPALGINVSQMFNCPDGMVICNGEDSPAWYRLSRVFGHTTVEWPGSFPHVPVTTASRVKKPTSHSCDCWEDMPIMHVGRYGRWEKGVLSHTAYFDAYKKIDLVLGGKNAAAEG